ncbi:MAG: efflux RND transporter periplasmic adaptor subunit [Burkholderiaceae bacterium]
MPSPSIHRATVVVLASLALVSCGGEGQGKPAAAPAPSGPPPAAVTVQPVRTAHLPLVFEYTGQVVGARDAEVRARVGGIVLQRNFEEGAAVRRGQSLYTLDSAPFRAALARAEAEVGAAQARVAQASRTLARLKPLAEAKAVSQREADDALSAEQIARADLVGAEARRAEARLNLGYTRVESPIAGVAGRSQVSVGSLVPGAQTLLTTVTQNNPLKVRFGIADTDQMRWRSEAAAGTLQLPERGAFEVELKLADGSVYARRGKLVFADARVSGNTGTVEAEAEIANPEGILKPGQFVRVRLLGGQRPNAVLVPTRAVLEGPQGKYVYLAQGGKATPRPVEVGEQLTEGWVITKGLANGDPVIVDGMARIFFPGAPIQVVAASAPSAAAPAPAASAASR